MRDRQLFFRSFVEDFCCSVVCYHNPNISGRIHGQILGLNTAAVGIDDDRIDPTGNFDFIPVTVAAGMRALP